MLEPRDILRSDPAGEYGTLTILGTAAGLILAAVSTQIVAQQIYGVSPLDPFTYGGVGLVLVAVAFAASYVPAHRAAKVDPMVALRYE